MRGDPKIRKRVLMLRGKLSYGLIAKTLGISRNVVSGICFRADWGPQMRICGEGRRGPGVHARQTLPIGGSKPRNKKAARIGARARMEGAAHSPGVVHL